MSGIPLKKILLGFIAIIVIIVVIVILGQAYDTVPGGSYQIAQEWSAPPLFNGKMKAKMEPGFWFTFGTTTNWAKGDTFFFTEAGDKDAPEDDKADNTIEVRFKDGSVGNISGTCRYELPSSPQQAIELVTKRGHLSVEDAKAKLIKPEVRTALRLTSSLMTATESYVNRGAFYSHVWEQLQKGPYLTKATEEWVEDPVTKEKKLLKVTKIVYDKDGNPKHKKNQLAQAGIEVRNIEIKRFKYSDEVNAQIKKQQQAKMAVDIAKANALKAEQDKKTAEAEGRALVARARAEEEEKKTRSVVVAEKDKAVAELRAQQLLEVAKLEKQQAAEQKAAKILVAEGEAQARKLKVQADNLLAKRIEAAITMNKDITEAWARRRVPMFVMGGTNSAETPGASKELAEFQTMVNALLAKSIVGNAVGDLQQAQQIPFSGKLNK